jgi:hypothetical protein
MTARANQPAMGIATDTSFKNKALYCQMLESFGTRKGADAMQGAIVDLFHSAAKTQKTSRIGACWISPMCCFRLVSMCLQNKKET